MAALAAAIVHVRAGRINWRLFAWMAPPSMVGAVAGGYLSGRLPDTALLVTIGAVLVYFGIDLLRERERAPRSGGSAREDLDIRAAVLTGAAVGVLGGLVGLILGSLRMPALIRYVGEVPARAVGTNLTVGVCVGIAGVIGHTPDGVDWELLAIGSAASVPGALLGARLTGRLSERQLLRAIGAVLVVAGAPRHCRLSYDLARKTTHGAPVVERPARRHVALLVHDRLIAHERPRVVLLSEHPAPRFDSPCGDSCTRLGTTRIRPTDDPAPATPSRSVPAPDRGGLALESQHGNGRRGEPEPSPALGRKLHPAGSSTRSTDRSRRGQSPADAFSSSTSGSTRAPTSAALSPPGHPSRQRSHSGLSSRICGVVSPS